MTSAPRRAALGAALALGLLVALAGPAAAHVTLHSDDAVQGASDVLVQIRTPNEESNATVTQLEVDFPADTPLIGLYVQPTAGWTFQVTNSNLPKPVTTDDGTITQYVSKVVWTGGNIPVGAYQDFNIDVSQMPSAPTLTVKALQTYSDGNVVRWIQLPGPQGQQPDHPAPTLSRAAAPPSPATPSGTATTTTTAAAAAAVGVPTTKSDNDAVAIIGVVLGALGLVSGGAAILAARRIAGGRGQTPA